MENHNRPSVLLVGNFLSATRGTRGVCEDLALGLKAAGWSVITTSSCPGRLARLADFLLTVWRQRKRYQVAQVDVYSGPSFRWAEWVCQALRIIRKPYILTLHGGNLPAFARRHTNRVRHLLQHAGAVTTPSAYLFEKMQFYRKDLVRLPNSLEIGKYPFRHRDRPEPNLMWLRAFHNLYNPSLAVKVVALLAKDVPSVRLMMIGPDKRDGSLRLAKDLAFKLGVLDRITFTGPVPKDTTPQWLNRGDIFLNTTNADNMPVSILEAMACGLCIVSTNVGGIPYLLEDERDALLIPAADEAEMAGAVQRLVTEDSLAERLSRNGRQKVEEFDWSDVCPRWEKLLIETAGEARK
jgi:glycosyltransferase involved in cell wall biosynthesis